MSSLRLCELFVGLSRIADVGMGFEPGEAARAAVIAVEIEVIDIVRVDGGRIVEHWNVVDRLGLLQQLGALPEPAAAT
jgi:hypothetical protein